MFFKLPFTVSFSVVYIYIYEYAYIYTYILCYLFMSIIIRCFPILSYLFMLVIIMFMGRIYYKLFNFSSFFFPNMYISSGICLYYL